MSKNPLRNDIEALELEYANSTREMLDWKTKLAWFDGFNLEQAVSKLRQAEQAEFQAQAAIHEERHALTGPASELKELTPKAAMGFDPRYWFSSERAIAKRQLKETRQIVADQKVKISVAEAELADRAIVVRDIQNDITVARSFDPLLAKAAVASLKTILDGIEPRLASLRQRSDDLDKVLKEPLEHLHRYESEYRRISMRIARAKEFESQLNQGEFEKRRIHDRCFEVLGDRSPNKVRRECEGELPGIRRSIEKLEARIDSLIRFAIQDIRHIVIDGNNICYEAERFIGLSALEALVPILAQRHTVTLIFDPSIRRKLSLSGQEIEVRFPQAKQVHIVAPRRSADETILSAAGDEPTTFVLSNDRFVDHPEHSVVKDKRVLRHEIVNRTLYLHELQIKAKFEAVHSDGVGS